MFPEPITIGPLNLTYYGLMVAVGVLAALILFSFTASKRNISPALARDFCFWMVLLGLLGSRFFYVVFHWPQFADNWLDIFAYWKGGLMFQGGLVSALLVSYFFLKRYGLHFWPTMDVMAPSLALGQSLGRIGCFTAGCCYGHLLPEDNPLAIVFPSGSLAPAGLPLWPTQLMESFGLMILAIFLTWCIRSDRKFFAPQGRIAALYLTAAGLLRLVMENLRGDFRGEAIIWGLPPTTLTAITAFLLGLVLLRWKRA